MENENNVQNNENQDNKNLMINNQADILDNQENIQKQIRQSELNSEPFKSLNDLKNKKPTKRLPIHLYQDPNDKAKQGLQIKKIGINQIKQQKYNKIKGGLNLFKNKTSLITQENQVQLFNTQQNKQNLQQQQQNSLELLSNKIDTQQNLNLFQQQKIQNEQQEGNSSQIQNLIQQDLNKINSLIDNDIYNQPIQEDINEHSQNSNQHLGLLNEINQNFAQNKLKKKQSSISSSNLVNFQNINQYIRNSSMNNLEPLYQSSKSNNRQFNSQKDNQIIKMDEDKNQKDSIFQVQSQKYNQNLSEIQDTNNDYTLQNLNNENSFAQNSQNADNNVLLNQDSRIINQHNQISNQTNSFSNIDQYQNQQMQDEEEQEQDQDENMDNLYDFTLVDNISLFSPSNLDWYQHLFVNQQWQNVGKIQEYQQIVKMKNKIINSINYYKFEKLFNFNDIKQQDKISFSQQSYDQIEHKDRDLDLEMHQMQIIESFMSVFHCFEQDKNKTFQYFEKTAKTQNTSMNILFKWVKIKEQPQKNASNKEQKQNNINKQLKTEIKKVEEIKYQYNHFFGTENIKKKELFQNSKFIPLAVISCQHRQFYKKLTQWGIKYHDLKDSLLNQNDHDIDYQNHKKYGEFIEKGREAYLVKDKFVNNLWNHIMNQNLEQHNNQNFEIVASFDFQNSQLVYPKQYFIGKFIANDSQEFSKDFFKDQKNEKMEEEAQGQVQIQQQSNSRQQKVQEQQKILQKFKNLSIFKKVENKYFHADQNWVYNLKLKANIPQYLVKKLAACLEEAGIKVNIKVGRQVQSKIFSIDVMNHLLNFSNQVDPK